MFDSPESLALLKAMQAEDQPNKPKDLPEMELSELIIDAVKRNESGVFFIDCLRQSGKSVGILHAVQHLWLKEDLVFSSVRQLRYADRTLSFDRLKFELVVPHEHLHHSHPLRQLQPVRWRFNQTVDILDVIPDLGEPAEAIFFDEVPIEEVMIWGKLRQLSTKFKRVFFLRTSILAEKLQREFNYTGNNLVRGDARCRLRHYRSF